MLLLSACDPPPPSPPTPAPSATPSDTPPPQDPGESAPDAPARQPEGVPFPLPNPLPPEAQPRTLPEPGPLPKPGPAPLAFWLGGSGTEDGRFHYPRAAVTGPDGSLYAVDKSGRIQRWSAKGRFLGAVRTPEIIQGKPTGLHVDAAGQLLVADSHYCRVLVYSPDLELRSSYGAPGKSPGCFMLLTGVHGVGDRHYTTDYGDTVARVQVFTSAGVHLRAFGSFGTGPTEFRRPMALCVDSARDRLFVADAVNHRIVIYTLDGERVGQLGGRGEQPGQLTFPYDVKLDAQDRLWVAEFGNQRVSVFGPTGEILGTWGEPGRQLGRLHRPWGVALGPADRLWVLDSGNDRVYALERSLVLAGGGEGGG